MLTSQLLNPTHTPASMALVLRPPMHVSPGSSMRARAARRARPSSRSNHRGKSMIDVASCRVPARRIERSPFRVSPKMATLPCGRLRRGGCWLTARCGRRGGPGRPRSLRRSGRRYPCCWGGRASARAVPEQGRGGLKGDQRYGTEMLALLRRQEAADVDDRRRLRHDVDLVFRMLADESAA